ncbi:MAG: bifunctional folylpolyglutamate synthase/dihydrofolate synthase [Bacteroidales bacterium]
MRSYKETIDYLFSRLPIFQRVGGAAYKEGLDNSIALDRHLNNPHLKYATIHVGGTNGKGSTSHLIAATLQAAGYKVGLYTSPHLVDFRERIRVNGNPISEEAVVKFVNDNQEFTESISPSFFELTMAMAFDYFAKQEVEVAVIEVGLGGRLDSTNIISPLLSIITNISFDHIQFLGNTLEKIASEKAGIIKCDTPVIIGEAEEPLRSIFKDKAEQLRAPIYFAEDQNMIKDISRDNPNYIEYTTFDDNTLRGELTGDCQIKNATTVLTALRELKAIGFNIEKHHIAEAFKNVTKLTGLRGRWERISNNPLAICDTGHNEAGIQQIVQQIKAQKYDKLRIVLGMANDKDVTKVLTLLPRDAQYYFTRASVPRALDQEELRQSANKIGLIGESYPCVESAYKAALKDSSTEDFIYIGGSTFIVADLLAYLEK